MKIVQSILILLVLVVGISSCKKYNQIDNGSTVKTPYSLYIGGYNGTLKKTNDALYFSTLFYTDNSMIRQIVIADSVISCIKQNFYYSKDDGKFLQLSSNFGKVRKSLSAKDSFYNYFIPNLSYYNDNDLTVYLCTESGIRYSKDFGKSFTADNNWAATPDLPRSITRTNNLDLYAMKGDTLYERKQSVSPSPWNPWTQVVAVSPNTLPVSNSWYISHSHDSLFAIDFKGTEGVYFSADKGLNWYVGKQLLPNTHEILFGKEVFGKFYIGLDSAGLFSFSGNQFKSIGKGIPWYAKVSDIIGKTVRYRTDAIRNYWFCATDQGLYISETDGTDWKLVLPGQWSTLR